MSFDYRMILERENRPITPEEERLMREWRAQGMSFNAIARRLKRCHKTIRRRLGEPKRRAGNPWTQDEIDLILQFYGQGLTPKQMAEYIPRHTPPSISAKLRSFGCRTAPLPWSDEEKELLVRMRIRGKSYKEIAAKLERTVDAVQRQEERRRKRMREDKKFQVACRVLEFCMDPNRVLRAIRDSQIVPHLLDEDTTDEELAGLIVRAKGRW